MHEVAWFSPERALRCAHSHDVLPCWIRLVVKNLGVLDNDAIRMAHVDGQSVSGFGCQWVCWRTDSARVCVTVRIPVVAQELADMDRGVLVLKILACEDPLGPIFLNATSLRKSTWVL